MSESSFLDWGSLLGWRAFLRRLRRGARALADGPVREQRDERGGGQGTQHQTDRADRRRVAEADGQSRTADDELGQHDYSPRRGWAAAGTGRPESPAQEPVHLNDIFHADTGETRQFWSMPYLPGSRYTGRPVYALTSGRTFSGGEDLC
jgi:hypothetical protein